MALWDRIRKGIENVDLDAVKKAALDKLEEAKNSKLVSDGAAAATQGWDKLKEGVERLSAETVKPETINDTLAPKGQAVQLPAVPAAPTPAWGKIRSLAIKGANRFVEWREDRADAAMRPSSTTYGSAEMASARELEWAGLGVKIPRYKDGEQVYDTSGLVLGSYRRGLLTYKGDTHHLVVAASGAGKFQGGVGLWINNGLPGATVLIDPKGEAARMFAPYLDAAAVLDPWNEAGFGSSSLNLLDDLTASNPNLVDDARALADALIIPSGGDSHWDTTARNFLASLLIVIVLDQHEEGQRHLLRLRELVTLPWKAAGEAESMENLLTYMQSLDLAGGTVRRAASAMAGRADKERQSIFSTMERDTAWLESPQVQKVVTRTELNLNEFAGMTGKTHGPVLFVVIPPRYLVTHRSWLRLVIAAASNAFKRVQVSDPDPWRRRRHIIVDEFPQLGHMSFVENDVAVARGYNIQYHLLVQNLSQLQSTYAAAWETFIANSLVQAFGVQDVFTSEYISKMLGTTTVGALTSSGGSSSSRGGGSSSRGWSRAAAGRPLRTPDEIRTMPRQMQHIFLRGMNPIRARLIWLYEVQRRRQAPPS